MIYFLCFCRLRGLVLVVSTSTKRRLHCNIYMQSFLTLEKKARYTYRQRNSCLEITLATNLLCAGLWSKRGDCTFDRLYQLLILHGPFVQLLSMSIDTLDWPWVCSAFGIRMPTILTSQRLSDYQSIDVKLLTVTITVVHFGVGVIRFRINLPRQIYEIAKYSDYGSGNANPHTDFELFSITC